MDADSQPPSGIVPTSDTTANSKLFDLARDGDTASLRSQLTDGAAKNATNDSGDTLIMLAAYHGHAETVKMLIEAGNDPNILNRKGQSPVAGAVFKGHEAVVKALVDGGADVRAGSPSALDAAKMFRKEEMVKILEGGAQS